MFATRRLPADCECAVGYDIRTAVASAARWQRCGHSVVERWHAPAWWRWQRGETLERLIGLSESLTFLALPGARQPRPSPAEARLAPPAREAGKSR